MTRRRTRGCEPWGGSMLGGRCRRPSTGRKCTLTSGTRRWRTTWWLSGRGGGCLPTPTTYWPSPDVAERGHQRQRGLQWRLRSSPGSHHCPRHRDAGPHRPVLPAGGQRDRGVDDAQRRVSAHRVHLGAPGRRPRLQPPDAAFVDAALRELLAS